MTKKNYPFVSLALTAITSRYTVIMTSRDRDGTRSYSTTGFVISSRRVVTVEKDNANQVMNVSGTTQANVVFGTLLDTRPRKGTVGPLLEVTDNTIVNSSRQVVIADSLQKMYRE